MAKKKNDAATASSQSKSRKEKPLFRATESWDSGVRILVGIVVILVLVLHFWTIWQGMDFLGVMNTLGIGACAFILGFAMIAIDYPLFLQIKAMPNTKLDIYRDRFALTKVSGRVAQYHLKDAKEIVLIQTPLRFNSSYFAILEFNGANEVMHLRSTKEITRKLRPLGFKQLKHHRPNIYGKIVFKYEPDN